MNTKNYLSIYAKSFNWSGFFLPKKIYYKCSVLYDFCRTIDNIADQNKDLEIKNHKCFFVGGVKKNIDNKANKVVIEVIKVLDNVSLIEIFVNSKILMSAYFLKFSLTLSNITTVSFIE